MRVFPDKSSEFFLKQSTEEEDATITCNFKDLCKLDAEIPKQDPVILWIQKVVEDNQIDKQKVLDAYSKATTKPGESLWCL